MPRRQFRWRPRRRRRPKRRFSRKNSLSTRVRKLETAVERKFIDTVSLIEVEPVENTVLWPVLGAPNATIINLVPQVNPPTVPASDETRIGDKVTLTSIQLDYTLTPHSFLSSGTNAIPNTIGNGISTLVRFMVVWFPGAGHPLAQIENVIEAPNSALSFYKRNGETNYKILHDQSHQFTYRLQAESTTPADRGYSPINGAKVISKLIPLSHASYYDGLPSRPIKGTLVYFVFHDPEGITVPTVSTYPNMISSQVFTRLTFDDS